jgi:signal transduction histidine kinase
MGATIAGRGGRLLGLAALIFSALLLASTAIHTVQQHSRQREDLDRSLTVAVREQTLALGSYLERARSIVLLSANNPAFARFYLDPGSRRQKLRRGGPALDQANAALVFLNDLYPDSIGEACFIDRGGAENARSVRGVAAPLDELSPDETGNPFFAPTFALPFGAVHHSVPYVSPDTGEWVIANSTLIPFDDGVRRAIVHFEVTIESFRREAAIPGAAPSIQVVDAEFGYVVLDSRYPQRIGAALGRPQERDYLPVVAQSDSAGILEVNGARMAYRRLPRSVGNANDWYVVGTGSAVGGLVGSIDPSLFVLMALATILFAFGVFALRSSLKSDRERVAGLQRDVEERRAAELALRSALEREHEAAESLRTLDDMKNGFLRAVSHELRTPLTSVLGYALTLQRMEEGDVSLEPAEKIDMLGRLASNAKKLDRLLADLLDVDRLGRGKVELNRAPSDIAAIVRKVVEEIEIASHVVLVQANPVEMSVDGPKIERVVENLIRNAIRHTPEGTSIWVTVNAHADGALITVEDDGPGVPDNLKEALFEPFRQGPSPTDHSQGTGIGLSLVARFAELHGGRAWIEDSLHGGASFQVFIPEQRSESPVGADLVEVRRDPAAS